MRIQNEFSTRTPAPIAPSRADASWQLAGGHALSLDARSVERRIAVTRGMLWLTFTAPASPWPRADSRLAGSSHGEEPDLPTAACDHWLVAGDSLVLPAGVGSVLEAAGKPGCGAVFQLLEAPVRGPARPGAWPFPAICDEVRAQMSS